jgi:hypothetical protein
MEPATTCSVCGVVFSNASNLRKHTRKFHSGKLIYIYSERQKYGINSLKIKQIFFQKNLWTGQF